MLRRIIDAIKDFFAALFGGTPSSITVINTLSLGYLKSFRTGQNTEIIVMKYNTFKEGAMKDKVQNIDISDVDAAYIMIEYDPKAEEVLRLEGAKAADSKIQSAIENANNGVLVIS